MFFTKTLGVIALGTMSALLCAEIALADCTPPECYGAVAAGMWRDWSGAAHVSIGSSYNFSQDAYAQQGALNQCHSGGGMNCAVVGHFSHGGCGYIASGNND